VITGINGAATSRNANKLARRELLKSELLKLWIFILCSFEHFKIGKALGDFGAITVPCFAQNSLR
jgi:hypothetical protein